MNAFDSTTAYHWSHWPTPVSEEPIFGPGPDPMQLIPPHLQPMVRQVLRNKERMRPGDWIAVDLDGTLAHFDHWRGPEHIGEPVPAMLARVKAWRAAGIEVRIFTARVSLGEDDSPERKRLAKRAYAVIGAWCWQHLGEVLPITCEKSFQCAAIYDDKAFRVVANEGRIVSSATGGAE
jgi:hypothetical protein